MFRKNMSKNKMFLLILFILVFVPCLVYCQELSGDRKTQTIDGSVTQVDFVGSTVLVNTLAGQLPFTVSDDTVIKRGTDKIGLEDIDVGDPVTIEFSSPSAGTYIAVAIIDNNLGNE
jgi:hypothetical protein